LEEPFNVLWVIAAQFKQTQLGIQPLDKAAGIMVDKVVRVAFELGPSSLGNGSKQLRPLCSPRIPQNLMGRIAKPV
jgi:hypothetical protein